MSNFEKDLETLSAYLDGELTVKERERVERLLEVDQDLQSWHEKLKRTRSVLRSTPPLRAPRNFFLTPEMVGQTEKRSRAFPILRFASAFAALLLALLFVGDLFIVPKPALAPSRAIQFAETVQEQMLQAEMEAEILPSQPAAAPAEPLAQESQIEGEAAAEAADENISSSMDSAPVMEKLMPTQFPATVEEAEEMLGGAAEPVVESDQVLEARAPGESIEEESQPGIDFQSIIRISEFSLLFIAVTTGIAAIYLYRKSRLL
jgi:hypothetical protein